MQRNLTTREVGELLGVETWRVQRVFETGEVAEPARFAGKRAIPSEAIPQIVDALRSHGWLSDKPEAQS